MHSPRSAVSSENTERGTLERAECGGCRARAVYGEQSALFRVPYQDFISGQDILDLAYLNQLITTVCERAWPAWARQLFPHAQPALGSFRVSEHLEH